MPHIDQKTLKTLIKNSNREVLFTVVTASTVLSKVQTSVNSFKLRNAIGKTSDTPIVNTVDVGRLSLVLQLMGITPELDIIHAASDVNRMIRSNHPSVWVEKTEQIFDHYNINYIRVEDIHEY